MSVVNRKFICISFSHLTDRTSHNLCIDYLVEQGVEVEYWDIVAITRHEYTESHRKVTSYLRVLNTWDDLTAKLKLPENKNAIYLMSLPYAPNFMGVFRLMTRLNCLMVTFAWGASPVVYARPTPSIFRTIRQPLFWPKKVFDKILMLLLTRMRLVKPMDLVFAAGAVLAKRQSPKTKVVPINFIDYDNYVQIQSNERLVNEGPYAVFLDTNLPYQADLKVCGLPALDPEKYYRSLNRFFELVESEYGLRVLIAAHPKSNYGSDAFDGRVSLRDNTPLLVRDAEFIITQTSASVSYAVLNKKPIIFIYTDDMLKLYQDTLMPQLHELSSYLESPLINIDEVTDGNQIAIGITNLDRYEKYKYDFLTTLESECTTTQQIFLRELSKC